MNQDAAAPVGNKLYEAAVGFLVSERSNTNAWEQVASFVANYPNTEEGLKDLLREFRIVERQVKKDFEVNKLPAAWRSAKSTAINALKAGIPLVGDNGAQPKTDVGKLISASKKGTLVRSDFDAFKHHFNAMMAAYAKLSGTDKDDAHVILMGVMMYPSAPSAGVMRAGGGPIAVAP